jgi:hypothetical protein
MMSEYISFKAGKEIEWLEINLLRNNKPISKSKIISLAEGVDEQTVDSWLSILERRLHLYRKPIYTVENNKITPNYSWEKIPEYFLCIYYSFNGANDYSGGTSLFERISGAALKNFINGEVLNLGFPHTLNFNENLDKVSALCFEGRGKKADSDYKDDGVDVVGFKSFHDHRSSNLYVLVQCAAGKHWTAKKPIIMNRWDKYILWYRENIIQSISTVDYVDQKKWDNHASTFGMLLDRLRIYNFLYEKEVDIELRKDVYNWCSDKIMQGI